MGIPERNGCHRLRIAARATMLEMGDQINAFEEVFAPPNNRGSFNNLIVWQRAIDLGLAVYKLTSDFPAAEQFGLTAQLRRAAVSVASNIAEGYGRASRGEYVQFLNHARGSNAEIETQLIFARELGFGTKSELNRTEGLVREVGRLLTLVIRGLRDPQRLP